MATYRFPCPQCRQELALNEEVATERSSVRCPFCRSTIPIPQEVIEDAGARRAAAIAKAEEQQRRREARKAERAARQERKRREAEEREREAERERRHSELEAALLTPEEAVSVEEVHAKEADVSARETEEKVLAEAHPVMFRNKPAAFILCVLLCFAGIGIVILLIWWLKCLGTKLTVTDERVILRHGIFAKHTTEVNVADVRTVHVSQSLGQRIFGVGRLGIASAGQAGIEIVVNGVPRPQQFAELIRSGRRQPG